MINKLKFILNIKSMPISTVPASIVSRYKITSVIIILVMLSHITFMHNIVHDYVICYGDDGHIEIENVNDCTECTPPSMFDGQETPSSQLSSKDCEDVSLDVNCFEEEQYVSKNNISINRSILKSKMFSFQISNHENNTFLNNKNVLENNILESYTNISLLI